MPKPFISFILFFLILISALFANHQNQKQKSTPPSTPLPNFSLVDTSGTIRSISSWQGKIIVINFWATWCPPCLKEIPIFIELQKEYKDKNVQFIGIAIDDPQLVDDFLSFTDINYPVLIAQAEGEALVQQLGNVMKVIPFTLIINQDNQIIYRHPGELSKEEIHTLLAPLFLSREQSTSQKDVLM